MIDLRLFRDALFRSGTAVQFLGFGAQFGALFLLPLLLQSERGLSPLESGLTTFPQVIGVMTMAPVAGRIYGRVGPWWMALCGLSLAGLAMLGFLRVDLQTNEWWILGAHAAARLGVCPLADLDADGDVRDALAGRDGTG